MKNTAKAILTHESRSWRSWEQFSAGHNKNLIMQLVLQQWFTDDCVSPRWRGLWKLQKLLSMETGPNIEKWTAQNLATGWSPVYYVWMFRTTQSGRRKKKATVCIWQVCVQLWASDVVRYKNVKSQPWLSFRGAVIQSRTHWVKSFNANSLTLKRLIKAWRCFPLLSQSIVLANDNIQRQILSQTTSYSREIPYPDSQLW